MNPIHQKYSLVDKPLSLEAEGGMLKESRSDLFSLKEKDGFLPLPRTVGAVQSWACSDLLALLAQALLFFLGFCSDCKQTFSSLQEMGFTESWGNHDFRRAYLLLRPPCIFIWGQQFCAWNDFKSWQVPEMSKLLCACEAISHNCVFFCLFGWLGFLSLHSPP